ncbi:MAG: D-alanyl-D-alanine carboxypeptidase [Hyphomicrobiaceae bacterium]|nr:D-alanyl-D-alanine carboxypeptidase [Hyphomicrobiaceae bacterium]
MTAIRLRAQSVLAFALLVLVFLASPAFAQLEFDTKAKYAILMDYESGTVLFQKNADERLEPASMAKLMTIAIVFDQLKSGRIKMDDEFFISEHAWRDGGATSGGSTMFAELGSKIPVADLVRADIIQSGNDASIALAEGIAGSEATFARLMNEKARELGLTNSHFVNATGLPDPNQYSSARDLATIARYIIQTFPEYYPIFSETEFRWNGITQKNRNVLLEDGIGVDGLKTGHTEEAGYGMVASTTEGGRRLIAVLHGLDTMRERAEEARKLVTWGSRSFDLIPAFKEGEIVGYANVYGGQDPQVGLVGQGELLLYLPIGSRSCISAKIAYHAPIRPPVAKGAELAQLRVFCDDQLIQTAPLFAANDVADGDLFRKSVDALKELALGWI